MNILNLSLFYYIDPNRTPFLSITSLPKEEAFETAQKLAPTTSSPMNRFCKKDFPGYYKKRLRTEAWLYREFVQKGGKPNTPHSIYFTLGKSDFLHKWFGGGKKYTFALKNIEPALLNERLSFTLGDSMSVIDNPQKTLFTFAELSHLLQTKSLEEIKTQQNIHYIEAQLWDTVPPC